MSKFILTDWQGAKYGNVLFTVNGAPDRLELNFLDGRTVALELEDNKIRVHAFGADSDDPFSFHILPPEKPMCIEVYAMNGESLAETQAEVTGYDIIYRKDGEDPVMEFEGLTLGQAERMSQLLTEIYPEAVEDWSCAEKLR